MCVCVLLSNNLHVVFRAFEPLLSEADPVHSPYFDLVSTGAGRRSNRGLIVVLLFVKEALLV